MLAPLSWFDGYTCWFCVSKKYVVDLKLSVHPAPPLWPSQVGSDITLHLVPVLHSVVSGLDGVGAAVLPYPISPLIVKWSPLLAFVLSNNPYFGSITHRRWWQRIRAIQVFPAIPLLLLTTFSFATVWSSTSFGLNSRLHSVVLLLHTTPWRLRQRRHKCPPHDDRDKEGKMRELMAGDEKFHWSTWWAVERFCWLLRSISRILSTCLSQLIALEMIFNREQ